jgi:hypothetical protein
MVIDFFNYPVSFLLGKGRRKTRRTKPNDE